MKAIVLLSGGIDSYVSAAIAKERGFDLCAISFNYGQPHINELKAAKKIAQSLGAFSHNTIKCPKIRGRGQYNYFPARNTIFLAIALSFAETLKSNHIFLGCNADDTNYPDCQPRFIRSFEDTARLGSNLSDLKLETPLLDMTKKKIIETGISFGLDFSITATCYFPDTESNACGKCPSCRIRLNAFRELGLNDPIKYV